MRHHVDRQTFDQVMVPNYAPGEIIPIRGQGSYLWDQEGRQYIDFAGGIAVNALGHCHPELVEVLHRQSEKLWHLSNVWTNEPALILAQQLCAATFAEKVFFANSGAEANEAAFKLARKYAHDHFGEKKHHLISFEGSFHGRTLFTVSVGGQPNYRHGFHPVPEGIHHLPFNDIDALEATISEQTCAVVMEPIQGEGGVITADTSFMQKARELCDRYQALLIFDEIQTGMGRTGSLFAYMEAGVTPDILTTAKALGCGFPIAAMLTSSEVASSFRVGSHGSTFGGNPLACRVASRALELVGEAELLHGVMERQQMLFEGLAHINTEYPLFSEVRGKGLLIGARLHDQYCGRARELLCAAQENGLMILIAGPDVIRLTPSLIIPQQDIEEGLRRLRLAAEQVLAT